MKRSTRLALAQQTLEIVRRGSYDLPNGRTIDIAPLIQSCLASTRFFSPEDLDRLRQEILARPATANATAIEVRNETTLGGLFRLVSEPEASVAVLNFASAKNPGGGFLKGSQAQEESLARSSALYTSLKRAPDFYQWHRAMTSCLYSDAMILSPNCPVFRDDEGNFLEKPVVATFLTCAAPNAGSIANNSPDELSQIPDVFRRRAENVLAVATGHGYDALLLGAWGCGVFRNDPNLVARVFADHLRPGGQWAERFRRVVFSVWDTTPSQQTFKAFQTAFQVDRSI